MATKKYITLDNLSTFLGVLKDKFASIGHAHDDLYYTESEIDAKLDDKIGLSDLGDVAYAGDEEAINATAPLDANTLGGKLESMLSVAKAVDSDTLGGKAPEYYIQPRNLLDNSDFTNPVNQRGQTSYTGSGYSIDRWRAFHAATTHEITADGIKVSATDANPNIYQALNLEEIDTTQVMTAAACDSDGNIYIWTGVPSETGVAPICVYISGSRTMFRLAKNNTTWKWAALYYGEYTAETLPPYVSKGYAAELLECKRYYRVIPYTITKRTGNYDETYYFDAMRATPTATIYSTNAVVGKASYYTGSWADMDVIITVWNEPFGGSIRLYASEYQNCNFGFAKIVLSADL